MPINIFFKSCAFFLTGTNSRVTILTLKFMDLNNIITNEFLKQYKGKQPRWGFNGLGHIVYKRTYSRIQEDGSHEEWCDTVARCINGAQKIGAQYTQEEAERLYDLIFNLKCSFGGRMLWQLGTSTVDRFGANSLLNCFFVSMREPKAFTFLFENLMLGGGVGFSVRREDVHELPRIIEGVTITANERNDADFIIPDSREGWVSILDRVLDSFFVTGKSFTYSTVLIRGKGEPINGFGGTASGPKVLVDGLNEICKIFQSRENKKLRSLDVLDICNIIGSIVVAGNVRRSAELAIGDPDDYLFIRAKNWATGKIPNWRVMSNNTLQADSYDHISAEVWNLGYETDSKTGMAKGEPYGFFNLPLAQKRGRLIDGLQKDKCEGLNPCGEIVLESYECCNLSEIFLNNIQDEEELWDSARLLYKTQKAIAAMDFIHEETTRVVHKNMRLGLGVTGICQSLDKLGWLDECYNKLRQFDEDWSKQRGWNRSIKLTTVKPSGTLSLLAGSTPGIHPAIFTYYIRRIRMSSNDKLVQICKDFGYNVEFLRKLDGSIDHGTVIIEFPCYSGSDCVLEDDVDIIDQLELVKNIQTFWSDNSVSVTAYYRKEDLPKMKEWMSKNYKDNIKSVSFLLKSNHGFDQAPYEEISKETYEKLTQKITPYSNLDVFGEMIHGIECEGGACPIR